MTELIAPISLIVMKGKEVNRYKTFMKLDRWIIKNFPDIKVGDFTRLE